MLLWTPAVARRLSGAARPQPSQALPNKESTVLCGKADSTPPPIKSGVKVHRWEGLHTFARKVWRLPSARPLFAQRCFIVVSVESTYVSWQAEVPPSRALRPRLSDGCWDVPASRLTAPIPHSSPTVSLWDHTRRRWRAIPFAVNGEAPRQQKPGEHGRGKHDYNPAADITRAHARTHVVKTKSPPKKQEACFP